MPDYGLQARSEIRRLLTDHDIRPKKSYGQNFLADPNIVERIVNVSGADKDTNVLEIGPGTGAMTGELARRARRVVAYEVDRSLEAVLHEAVGTLDNVEIRYADAARVRFSEALDDGDWLMVANLPYNVGTGIILDTLQHDANVTRFVIMVQREVADRLVAPPGNKVYGIPSVVVGLHGSASIAFNVPPQVFEPQPRVESAVVVIDRDHADPAAGAAIAIATTAFGQRRKTLRRSLSTMIDDGRVFEIAGIDPQDRPERLAPEAFLALASAMDT